MIRAFVRLTNLGLLTASLVAITVAHADTLLVGTSLATPVGGPELCPLAADCSVRLSQFSTPIAFVIDDVKVAISAPGLGMSSSDGSFQVNLTTSPEDVGGEYGLGAGPGNVGSGSLVFDPSDPSDTITQVFDFNNLSILIEPGTEYYLVITGANVSWAESSPVLAGLGTLGLQLECDPYETCIDGRDGTLSITYAEQISGDPVPEPSTWVLMGTGLFSTLWFSCANPRRHPDDSRRPAHYRISLSSMMQRSSSFRCACVLKRDVSVAAGENRIL